MQVGRRREGGTTGEREGRGRGVEDDGGGLHFFGWWVGGECEVRAGRESDGVRTREARFRFKNWWVRLRSWGRGVTGVAGCGGGLLVSVVGRCGATTAMSVTVSGLVGYM